MVRVRRQSTGNHSIPIRNSGIRRRYLLRERNRPTNNVPTQEQVNQIPIEDLSISPITVSSSPLPANIIEEPRDVHTEGYSENEYDTVLEHFLTIEVPLDDLLQAWEQEQSQRTADKQTQCGEEDFVPPPPPVTPRYSPNIESPEPNYSPVYAREYSPVLNSFPRWYILPEEYSEQTLDNTSYGTDEVD